MTVLTAMQSAALRLVGRKPTAFFASQDTFEMEIVDLLNEAGSDIAAAHDWRDLMKVHTFTGDGTTTDFSKPSDYDRMVNASSIADGTNWMWGYTQVSSINEWITLQDSNAFGLTPGWWILLGGLFQFYPAPPAARVARLPYMSGNYAVGSDAVAKAAFTADDDTFALDEQLLALALVWRWRELKHLDSTGDQANFERSFSEAAGRDAGARVIRPSPRRSFNAAVAYPFELG